MNKKLTFSYFSKYNGEIRFSLDTNNMYYLRNKIIDIDFGENIKVYVENKVHFAISDKLEFKKIIKNIVDKINESTKEKYDYEIKNNLKLIEAIKKEIKINPLNDFWIYIKEYKENVMFRLDSTSFDVLFIENNVIKKGSSGVIDNGAERYVLTYDFLEELLENIKKYKPIIIKHNRNLVNGVIPQTINPQIKNKKISKQKTSCL